MTFSATCSSAAKYPDVILPMCVLRRLDAVLEPAKKHPPRTLEEIRADILSAQNEAKARWTNLSK
jgi:hypothetical protein